jgi:hypothetical protein
MKALVSALLCASLTALPMTAAAQMHGSGGGHMGGGWGHGGHAGWAGHSGFRGSGFHGSAAGFHHFDHGFDHFHHHDFDDFFFVGFAAWPWFWDWPGYWGGYYYPYAPYPYGWYDDDSGYGGYGGAPPSQRAAPPAACGGWVWKPDQGQYLWEPAPCASPTPQQPAQPPPNS